jgi:predicted metal-dependent peptidase
MDAEARMSQVRGRLFNRSPFYGSLALKLDLVIGDRFPRLATDGTRLYVNPAYLAELDAEDEQYAESAVAHEAWHCGLQHPYRLAGRDALEWNVSTDLVINAHLKKHGFTLHPSWLYDPQYDGDEWTPEMVYAHRRSQQPEPPTPEPEDEEDATEDPGEEPTETAEDEPEEDETGDEPTESEDGEDEPAEDAEDVREPIIPDEPGEDVPDVRSGPGVLLEPTEDAPGENTQEDWEVFAQQAVSANLKAGTLPGGADRAVRQAREQSADWRTELDRFLEPTAPSDYAWSRPNRALMAEDVYVPGVVMAEMPDIDFAVDTSGSVTAEMLAAMAGHLTLILEQTRPRSVRVTYFDDGIQGTETFYPGDTVTLNASGGGGTCFSPVLAHYEERAQMGEPVTALVVLTDLAIYDLGYLPEPDYPVLWVTPLWVGAEAPYGRTIRMDLGSSGYAW